MSVDVAGAVGGAVARPGWSAALAPVPQETQAAGTTFERPHSVGADGIWVTASIVTVVTFVNVTADLFAGSSIVNAHSRHSGALVPLRTGLAVEARHGVDAAGPRETGVSVSTLVDVFTVGAIAVQARWAGPTAVAWVLIHFHAVHTSEAGAGAAV